jgi:hypothetical protein
MALTGFLETDDGVQHPNAYGLCFPLVVQTFPTQKARWDFNIWHDYDACIAGKSTIKNLGFSVEGESLGVFMIAAVNSVRATVGETNGHEIVAAAIEQMQSVVKQNADFADWAEVE